MYRNKKEIIFCCRLEGNWQKDQYPDPLVRGTGPRIRVRTNVPFIHKCRKFFTVVQIINMVLVSFSLK